MSTFPTLTASREQSQPIELFEFLISTDSFFYTSSDEQVTAGGRTWTPVEGMQVSDVIVSDDDVANDCEVDLPIDDPLVELYRNLPPGATSEANYYRLEANDPALTPVLAFAGTIQSIRFNDDGTATLLVRSLLASLSKTVPNHFFQLPCNHLLGGPGCGVDLASFRLNVTVATSDGLEFTASTFSSYSNGYFVPGDLRIPGTLEFRRITYHVGNTIRIRIPFRDGAALNGQTLIVTPGCNHLESDCSEVFDNVSNYGGFLFIPTRNIFREGLV